MPARIRKGDRVVCISGKDKGKSGIVMEVHPREQRVLVEGLNIVKRHTKPRPPNEPGGVIEKTVRKGVEPKAQTLAIFTGETTFDPASRYAMRSLAELLGEPAAFPSDADAGRLTSLRDLGDDEQLYIDAWDRVTSAAAG